MYLHRYPHIQSIHPYINRHVHMDLNIPRQCIYSSPFWWWNLSHSSCHFTTIYSLQSHRCGGAGGGFQFNYDSVLITAYKLSPHLQHRHTGYQSWATLLSIMAVELDLSVLIVLWGHYSTRLRLRFKYSSCSITVYVQNAWTTAEHW